MPWAGLGAAGGWVGTNGGRAEKEPLKVATPPGDKVGLDIGRGTAIGGGWVEATRGRTTKESLMVATPLGDKVGPEVGASTGVDAGGGTVGCVTGIGLSQARTVPTRLGTAPRLPTSQPDI